MCARVEELKFLGKGEVFFFGFFFGGGERVGLGGFGLGGGGSGWM